MSQPANSNLARKILKITGIALACILGLILIATFLLLTFLEPYAERFIKKQITENTEGLYSLDFEEIHINFLTGTIQLQEAWLQPDSLVYQRLKKAGEASKTTFDLKTSELEISGIGLFDVLLRNHLSIRNIYLEEPKIITTTDGNVKVGFETEEEENDIFEDFFNSVKVGKINISEANFRHFTIQDQQKNQLHELPLISLQIYDLELKASDQPGQAVNFNFNDLNVLIEDYKYQSSDQLIKIGVEHMIYGLEGEELLIENIKIEADSSEIELSTEEDQQHLLDIEVPGMQITGLNVLEGYQTGFLQIDNFIIQRAKFIFLENEIIPATDEPIDLKDIYEDFSNYLQGIQIAEVMLLDGELVYKTKLEETQAIHSLEQIDFTLHNLQIDSATIFFPEEKFFVDDLQFRLENYSFQHPSNPYKINLKQLALSSLNESLTIDSINILADLAKNRELKNINEAHEVLYNLKASKISLAEFNLVQAFKSTNLDIGYFTIESSHIDFLSELNADQVEAKISFEEIYNDYSDFLSAIRIRQVKLDDISFNHYEAGNLVKQVQQIKHASIIINEIHIDSTLIFQPNPKIPVENLTFTARNYSYWLPEYTINLNSIHYSTVNQRLSAIALNFIPKQKFHDQGLETDISSRKLYNLSAPQFQISGLDVFEIFNEKKLEVDEVLVRQPDFSILINRDISPAGNVTPQEENIENVFEIVHNISVNTVAIEDGTFTYFEKRDETIRTQKLEAVSASILNLNLNQELLSSPEDIIPMEEMILTAREYTYRSPDEIYEIKLEQLKYSSLRQILNARFIRVNSDKEAHEALKINDIESAERNLFDISADKFQISGLDLIRAFESGFFVMDQIVLSEPEVAIFQDQNIPYADPEEETEDIQEDIVEQINEVIETFKVNNIHINDGTFKLNVLKDTLVRSQTIEHVSLTIDQLRLVSLEARDIIDMFDMDDVEVLIKDYSYLLPDSLYTFEVGELKTSLQDQTLTIDTLRLIPLLLKEEFADNLEYVQDRFDIVVPSIEMEGIELRELFDNQNFVIESVLVKNSILDVYRDNQLEQDPERRPKTLQNMLRQVDNLINVDSLIFQGGKLTYSELPPDRDDPIALILDDLHLGIHNITNDSSLIAADNNITIKAATQFMGKSKLEVDFLLQLDHPDDFYSYEGTLESMDFDAFNSIFENLLFIRIRAGQINKVDFSVEATEHLAEGTLNFFYNDLNIKFIDRRNPGNPRLRHRVGSWLVNNFLIKSDNPTSRGKFRVGEIEVERDYQKSVFNHMSSAMLDGMTSSLMPPFVEKIFNFFTGD